MSATPEAPRIPEMTPSHARTMDWLVEYHTAKYADVTKRELREIAAFVRSHVSTPAAPAEMTPACERCGGKDVPVRFVCERCTTSEKSWKKLAMEVMRYLDADQIAAATKAAGAQTFLCGTAAFFPAAAPDTGIPDGVWVSRNELVRLVDAGQHLPAYQVANNALEAYARWLTGESST